MKRRALVVDDDRMLAALVGNVLRGADFEVALAHTATTASTAFEDFDPDVAILDISLGRGPSGIDLAHLAHKSYPGTAVLLLTRYPDLRTAQTLLSDVPPGCGFLNKDSVADPAVLLDAVEGVLRDTPVEVACDRSQATVLADLTRTQLAVLHMVAQGLTTSEIARRRACTVSAVEKILGTIYQRLGINADDSIHPRVEAIRVYAAAIAMPERAD